MAVALHKSGGGSTTTAKKMVGRLQRPRVVKGCHEDDERITDVCQDVCASGALMSKNEITLK